MTQGVNGKNIIGGINFNAEVKSAEKGDDGKYKVELKNGSIFTFNEQRLSELQEYMHENPEVKQLNEHTLSLKDVTLESLQDNPEQKDAYMFNNGTKIKEMSLGEDDMLINYNGNAENIKRHE